MSTTISSGAGIYAPGADITAQATAAVTARTFVAITADRPNGGNIQVAPATAGGRVVGVAKNDAPVAGMLVSLARGNSRVVPVVAGGPISAFAEVQVGSNGQAVAKSSGVAVGYALTSAVAGAPAEISLY